MATTARLVADAGDTRPAHISDEEWDLRVQLAAAYRIFDHLGWTLLIFNHISMRLPGAEHHFLINPYGLRYDEVCASNLVKIDLQGNKLEESPWGVNPAGFVIHSAIHEHVPEALCIMHTHTKEGLAVASKKAGLRNNNFYSSMLHDQLTYHDFQGVTDREEEKPDLVRSIGSRPIVILRNHGLLTHGRTIPECFMRMWTVQMACEAQVLIDSLDGETIEITEEASINSTRTAALFANDPIGDSPFDALVRLIDAKDPSYRT